MKYAQLKSIVRLFFNLLRTDLLVYFKSIFLGDLIDTFIWVGSFIFVMTYILPQLGLQAGYSAFYAVGMIISAGFWDVWTTTTKFISDLEGDRVIGYYLTLPLPATLYFIKQIAYNAIRAGSLSICVLPLAKVILLDKLDLSQIHLFKFALIFIAALLFSATMSLIMASMVKDINNIGHVGLRTLFPMWLLGGTQYSWYTLVTFSPIFAYLCLANPLLYATEGMHAAALGQEGYMPFWSCLLVLCGFIVVVGWWGIRRMKKRLDCV